MRMRKFRATFVLSYLIGIGVVMPSSAQTIDPMAQRMAACTGCHGKEGRAGPDGFYPRIAGKPAEYIYRQLKNFQETRRDYSVMTHMVRNLSDDYLKSIATYFSGLDLPYPAPLPATAPVSELKRGEQLVKLGDPSRNIPACNQCHGEQMTGMLPATPGLLGLPRDYVNSQVGAWKEGTRKGQAPDCMNKVAKQLNADDLSAISSWLSAQTVPTNSKPVAERAVSIAARCNW
jgi:cytochrome c553